jgi:hypothetical protein
MTDIYAILERERRRRSGTSYCRPVWSSDRGPGLGAYSDSSGPAALADGRVYGISSSGSLRSFALSPGEPSASPSAKRAALVFYLLVGAAATTAAVLRRLRGAMRR